MASWNLFTAALSTLQCYKHGLASGPCNLASSLPPVVAGRESEPHQAVRREQGHRGVFPFKSALQTGPCRPHSRSGGQAHRALQPEEDQARGGFHMGPGGGEHGVLPQQIISSFLSRQTWAARYNLLANDYSLGLSVLNESPKSHCPIV